MNKNKTRISVNLFEKKYVYIYIQYQNIHNSYFVQYCIFTCLHPLVRHTLKRSRAVKHIDVLKLPTCEMREIKSDVEFSDLFGQLLEKRSNYIKKNFRVI